MSLTTNCFSIGRNGDIIVMMVRNNIFEYTLMNVIVEVVGYRYIQLRMGTVVICYDNMLSYVDFVSILICMHATMIAEKDVQTPTACNPCSLHDDILVFMKEKWERLWNFISRSRHGELDGKMLVRNITELNTTDGK